MLEKDGEWIEVTKELPPCDGTYEITNNPQLENDWINRYPTGTAYYNGYGFEYLGIYRSPKYWRKYEFKEKKYGKVIEEKMEKDTKQLTEQEQIQNAFDLILELSKLYPDIEANTWISCCFSLIAKSYQSSNISYEQFCEEIERAKLHYKSWFDNP